MTPPRTAKIGPVLIVSIVANALLIAGLAYYFLTPKSGVSTGGYGTGGGGGGSTQTPPPAAGTVESLGRIQPSGGLISVYGPVGDKVVKFNVNVGETVAEDRMLAELAGDEQRKLELARIDALIQQYEATSKSIEASRDARLSEIDVEAKQALATVDQDLAIIDAKLTAVEATKNRAQTELNRLSDAKKEGVNISDQEFETLRVQLAQAEAERVGSVAQKEKINIQRQQSAGLVEAKKASLRAETESRLRPVDTKALKAEKLAADRKLQDAQLRAPTAGRIVRIMAKPGDTLTNQPVLQLANLAKMSVLAEVYETDVGRIREWLKKGPVSADIDGRALGDSAAAKLHGTVTSAAKISTVIAKNVLTPLGPREDADRRVVEVEVDLDAASSKAAETFIGLQVRVRFEPPK